MSTGNHRLPGAILLLLSAAGPAAPQRLPSFFHAEGRHLVSSMTGERYAFRGVNLSGLDYGARGNNRYPGTEGTDYFRPASDLYLSLQSAGFNVVRVPLEWARLVPGWTPGAPLPAALEPEYAGYVDEAVARASAAQLYVILDLHDFLKYWSGPGREVCVDSSAAHHQLLAHTWRLLAARYAANPVVLGYDLMNEPVRTEAGEPCGSCNWKAAAQTVVDAIRTVDTNHLILVEGPNYSLSSHWPVEVERPFITDRINPPRVAYSPHAYFDAANRSTYNGPGERNAPLAGWEHQLRDSLLAMLDWSVRHDVPIFLGEFGVPCSQSWAEVLDRAFRDFLEPLRISATAWDYVDPLRCPLGECPLNMRACPQSYQFNTLKTYPGGPYQDTGSLVVAPSESTLYGDSRVRPWDAGTGSFDEVEITPCAGSPVQEGACSLGVRFSRPNFAGVKFLHPFGVDARRFDTLAFWVYLTGTAQQNVKIFTTRPRPDCDGQGSDPVYPATYDAQPVLSDYLPLASRQAGQWQRVEIPLAPLADPAFPILNGIAFQNMGTAQDAFFLDRVELVSRQFLAASVTPPGAGFVTRNPAARNNAYPRGSTVQLQANSNPGFQFIGWSGGVAGQANPLPLVMAGDRSVTAHFVQRGACTYALSLPAVSLNGAGGIGHVDVAAPSNCIWSAVSAVPWMTLNGPRTASGNARVRFVAGRNGTGASRTGQLNIAGAVLPVAQAPDGCVASLSGEGTLPAPGGSAMLTVAAPAPCAWSAVAAPEWLRIAGGGSGTGGGAVQIQADPNPSSGFRTAAVTVAGQTLHLVQSGVNPIQVFSDVPLAGPFAGYISLLRTYNITSGCSPAEYCPAGATTRGQMAVFVVRSILGGDTFDAPSAPYFEDVPATHPYFRHVQKMRQMGITAGCTGTRYCPDDPVTRGQMAVFLVRGRLGLAAGQTFPYTGAPFFSDVGTAHAFFPFIQTMRQLGITVGCTATAYCPDAATTREQMAAFLIRAFF